MNNKLKRVNLNHSFIFFLFSNFIFLLTLKIINFTLAPIICLLLILTIGVSHGSLDHTKGKKLLQILNIKGMYIFYLLYTLISISIIILWIFAPSTSLIIFLIVASFHFGKEDTKFLIEENSLLNQLLFFLKGSLIILAPIFFHFDETITIFRYLLIDNEAFYSTLEFIEVNNIIYTGILLSTFSSIYLFLKNFEIKKITIFLDYFSILIINYFLSPLVAFTVYFCFLHSIRHSISLVYEIDKIDFKNGLKIFVKRALPLTILTAILCVIGLYLLNNSYDLDNSILKIVFIGLASLTFPHILLEYFLEKNEK
ncbi:Brp/Blh family beta-carotene 15,15'-dioxygenase [Candidatus Pelagibacter bacterium nBUS_36]|uniref:Brp/Blh family beta-carotene 15,15'-dioxygenase n=1 Tax=Candidatus Pelagibacter bacterium nBUS_36 TaxID=3374194 RepID=UPI003EBC85CD